MKRSMVLSIALGSLILIMSLGANAYQHSQVKQAQQQISRLQQQKRQVSQQLTKTNQQKQLLSTQIDSYKTPKIPAAACGVAPYFCFQCA